MTEARTPEDSADLAAVAAELYALVPEEFTAARDARAAAASDPAMTRSIKALRKPVVAAWIVGEFARRAPDELGGALALAAELREAQDDLDSGALAVLNRQRRALVSALTKTAAGLAAERGVPSSPATLDAVEKTLNAAMRDAGAAAAVASGRLIRPLEASGLDPIDLDGAVGGGLDAKAAQPPAPASRDDLAERRARKQAEREARDADRAATEAQRALTRLESKVEAARERAGLLGERVDAMRSELARIERDAAAATAELDELDAQRTDAASVVQSAEKRADAARAALE